MSGSVAVVTDSTAYLPAELVAEHDVVVVPLHAVIGDVAGAEGVEVSPTDVALALRARRVVRTSRPSPGEFARVYQDALERGANAVVSVHLSSALSGTLAAARVAAEHFGAKVTVLDSRATAMGLGFAVLGAAEAARAGAGPAEVVGAARDVLERTTVLFCVDSLEYLRRGGRIGAAAALLGSALAVKPILRMGSDGAVHVREKVRTGGRAVRRLSELAAEAAGPHACDVAVHHLDAAERAAMVREKLRDLLSARGVHIGLDVVAPIGAVIGAHTGPGSLGVVVVRRDGSP